MTDNSFYFRFYQHKNFFLLLPDKMFQTHEKKYFKMNFLICERQAKSVFE